MAMAASESSDPVDPLADYSLISLFPAPFGVLKEASKPYDLYQDLDSIHDHLKSIGLQNPHKLLDQAKAIIKDHELSNSIISENVSDEAADELHETKGGDNPKRRRPGLGLKRPRFSMKPDCSQPLVNLELTFDVDKYEDPDEFFEAYAKYENAKREIQRQTGVTMDQDQSKISRSARPRRPGLSRKSFNYKNLFDESLISSQDLSQPDDVNMSISSEQEEVPEPDVEPLESELAGSIKVVGKADDLFNDLLSRNFEELDGDGAVNIIQERLQIEPLNIESLCLPDMQDIQRNDVKASGGKLSKPRRALSDIQNIFKVTHTKSPAKKGQEGGSSENSAPLSVPPKSPFAPISLLKKQLFKANSSADPYSPDHISESDMTASSHNKDLNMIIDKAGMRKKSGISQRSEMVKDGTAVPEIEVTESNINLDDENVNSNMNHAAINRDLQSTDIGLDVQNVKEAGEPTSCDPEMGNSTNKEVDSNQGLVDPSIPSAPEEPAIQGPTVSISSSSEKQTEEHIGTSSNGQKQRKSSPHKDKRKRISRRQSVAAPPNLDVRDRHMLESSETIYEEHPEILKEALPESLNKRNKAEQRQRNERLKKEFSRRKSLAAAGTSWDAGVRRSTRIRSRPLEYWKGERFLYGRIHGSLATVIGVKIASPGTNDGKPTLKVKSYVADQYQELVDLVGLH